MNVESPPHGKSTTEVVSSLVRLTVFKTDGGRIPSLVSSILIYLRQFKRACPFSGQALLCSVDMRKVACPDDILSLSGEFEKMEFKT